MGVSVNLNIVLGYCLIVPCLVHSTRRFGYWRSMLFFLGSIIVTGTVENLGIIFGGYYYPGTALTIWYYKCPLDVCLGWYYIAYSCVCVAEKTIRSRNVWATAALGACLAVNLDLFLDPVAVANGWWKWTITNIYLLNVPINNWLGWWFLVFWFAVFYELTVRKEESLGTMKTTGLFLVMTVVCTLCVGICLSVCNEVVIPLANVIAYTPDMALTRSRLFEILIVVGLDLLTMGLILLVALVVRKDPRVISTKRYLIPAAALAVYWSINFFLDPHTLTESPVPFSQKSHGLMLQFLVICLVSFSIMLIVEFYLKKSGQGPASPRLDITPVVVLLVFWATTLVMAALTGPFYVLLGLTLPLPFLAVILRVAYRILARKE